jgi:hypothetical protein
VQRVGEKLKELLHAHVGIHAHHVREVSDAAPQVQAIAGYVVAEDRRVAAIRPGQRGEYPDQSGLPSPIGPDQADQFAGLHSQLEPVQRTDGAVVLPQIIHVNGGSHG